ATHHPRFLEWNEQAETEDLLAEIALVQLGLQDGLVKMLELRKREFGRQEFKSDGLITHLSFEPGQRGRQNFRVIERQLWNLRNGKPTGIGRVRVGFGIVR